MGGTAGGRAVRSAFPGHAAIRPFKVFLGGLWLMVAWAQPSSMVTARCETACSVAHVIGQKVMRGLAGIAQPGTNKAKPARKSGSGSGVTCRCLSSAIT